MVIDSGGGDAPSSTRVTFDTRVYALPIIKKAAYRYLKSFATEITLEGDTWICTLKFVAPTDADVVQAAERDLRAEVLYQDLRASIARETEPVRNAILALAFSRTGLQESE
jgi:His-Xaa-Ser system protein HxsD